MEIEYYPDTDSLFIKLKPGIEAEGAEVAPGIVFHYTPEGEVTAIDIDSQASKVVDVSSLAVEGMPLTGEAATQLRREEAERLYEVAQGYFEKMVETLRAQDREKST